MKISEKITFNQLFLVTVIKLSDKKERKKWYYVQFGEENLLIIKPIFLFKSVIMCEGGSLLLIYVAFHFACLSKKVIMRRGGL